jgi:uncharacterized protein YjlB
MFFEVRRLVLSSDRTLDQNTAGRFHVLNVVEGEGVMVEPAEGPVHPLTYAETLILPAAVGKYRLRRIGDQRVRLVKAFVR